MQFLVSNTECLGTWLDSIRQFLTLYHYEAGGMVTPKEIKEIFALFDKQQTGFVQTAELGTLLRALNLNPTQ